MNKSIKKALLYLQMVLTILLLITSVYLLIFVLINNLGAWMTVSYIFITLSVLSIICYSIVGYKKDDMVYQLAIVPFLAAIFVNILLPMRETLQVALLVILFALTFGFLLRPKDKKFSFVISFLMVVVSLIFSIYSAIKADVKFLGEITENWPTYIAMYLSIFIPTIMSGTIALTYNIRSSRR